QLPAEAQDVLRAELAVVEAELRVQEGQAVRPDDLAAQFGIPAEPIHAWLNALQAGSVQETASSPFWTPAAQEPRPPPGEPARGKRKAAALPRTPPCRFGEYELLAILGGGGMGTVYRARHRRLDREVALKVIRTGRDAAGQATARFEREMRAVGQ